MPQSSTCRKKRPSAWLIAVSTITLLVVAAVAARSVIATFVISDTFTGARKHALRDAQCDTRTIQLLAEGYRLDHSGQCPTITQLRAEGPISPSSKTVDPWGRPYGIRCDGDETYVFSFGPDRKEGTADDLRFPER